VRFWGGMKGKMDAETIFSLRKLALLGAMEQPIKLSAASFSETLKSSVQTAARRLQEMEREGLIYRRIMVDGQWVMLTRRGIDVLKAECQEYRQIFFAKTNLEVELVGKVITGLGEGKYYTTLEGYKRQFKRKLGFFPFPGTLNIKLDARSIEARRMLDFANAIRIEGFKTPKRTFGGGRCYPCEILHERAKGIRSFVIIPERTHYPDDIIEIISPVFLRKELQLNDGDYLALRVKV